MRKDFYLSSLCNIESISQHVYRLPFLSSLKKVPQNFLQAQTQSIQQDSRKGIDMKFPTDPLPGVPPQSPPPQD